MESIPHWEFLSTPSARRATHVVAIAQHIPSISIHALREEGDLIRAVTLLDRLEISIHALREEGDLFLSTTMGTLKPFLSTPSARRATHYIVCSPVGQDISIHALREEGD